MFYLLMQNKKLRYLCVGGWNTLFGYTVMIFLYSVLSPHFHIVLIALIANILAITMSFLTYKIWVFKTNGNWIIEYCKCYFIYGGLALLNVALNWFFVDIVNLSIWISQAISIPIAVVISYLGHSRFTFKSST